MTHSNGKSSNKHKEEVKQSQSEAEEQIASQSQALEQAGTDEQRETQSQASEQAGTDEQREAQQQAKEVKTGEVEAEEAELTYNYDHLDKPGIPPAIWIMLYSLFCGVMLVVFSIIQDWSQYIFSLLALYAGFKFFQKFNMVSHRVIFIILSIVIYFFGFILFVGYAVINEWDVPGITDQISEIE